MKYRGIIIIALIFIFQSFQPTSAVGGFGDFFEGIKKALGTGELTDSKIISGLKEALKIGSGNAVEMVSRVDGYYKNPKIRIPLPGVVQKVEKILRGVGYGSQVDAFMMSMNRAAEQAAPKAKSLFWDAIKQMNIKDARKILEGQDDAGTLYFREKTNDRLHEIFKPIVHSSMSKVNVTRYYQDLNAKVKSIPFAGNLDFDLDKYVTDHALDGLFNMLAEEERKIRQDPTARVTDLLKEVFGGK